MTAVLLLAGPVLLGQLGESPNEVVARAGRVGISLDRRAGALVIDAVEPGSSAEQAGLKVGDQVLRIDLDNTGRFSTSEAAAALRGVLGSRSTLTVLPRAQMVPRRVDVLRDVRVYLAHEPSARLDAGELDGALRRAGQAVGPDVARPRYDASLVSATAAGAPAPEAIATPLGRSGPDVATCIGALHDVLPEGFPAEFGASFTVRRETISVRTDPPSGDLASCLGRKAARWGLPAPGRKDPPVTFEASWRWHSPAGAGTPAP